MTEKKKSFKEFFLPIIVLVSICAVIAAAMATVNFVTEKKIENGHKQSEEDALSIVVPNNDGFTEVELSEIPESVIGIYVDNGSAKMALMLSVKGYDSSSPMSVAVGFDENGKITKCHVISCNGETKGIGSKVSDESFLSRFYGVDNVSSVDTISGATISSKAFKEALADACAVVEQYKATEVTK